jgi:hypothetical protein
MYLYQFFFAGLHTMNPFHDVNRDPRDPRTYGKNNNDRQFFPPISTTPGPSLKTPSYAERTSISPKPMLPEKVSTIDQTTLAVVPHTNSNDRDILHVDFYNALKSFPTSNFNSDVHINCVTSLKRIFSLFKDNDKFVRGNWDDARRRNDELSRDLKEKEEKIQQLEFSEAEAKKAFDDRKESVSKMRIDTLRYKTETDKAKNELSFVTSVKNRLIVAIVDEKDRHMKTVAKYDALNNKYANLFRENEKLNNDLIEIRQKIEQMEAEKAEKHLTPPPQEPASSSHSSRRAEKEKKKAAGEGHKKLQKQKHRDKTAVLEKLKPSEIAYHRRLAIAAPPKPQDNEKSAVAADNEEASSPSIHEERSSSSQGKTPAETETPEENELTPSAQEEQTLSGRPARRIEVEGAKRTSEERSSSSQEKTPAEAETPKEDELTPSTQEEPTPSGRPSRRAKAEGAKRTSAIFQKPKPKKSTPRQKRSHPDAAAGNDVEAHEEEEKTIACLPAKRARPSTKK